MCVEGHIEHKHHVHSIVVLICLWPVMIYKKKV